MTAMMKLTKAQRAVLAALLAKDSWVQSQGFGLNPCSFGGKPAAATARTLARRGLVGVKEYAPGHFRYWITESGRSALQEASHD